MDVFVLVCCYVSDSRFEGLDAEVEAFSGDGGWCCDVEERGFFGYGFFFGLKKVVSEDVFGLVIDYMWMTL